MMKLFAILAPFLIGRFMPQPVDNGPSIIEKTLLTYRKILSLTLIGIVGAIVSAAGLIIAGYGIALGFDAVGTLQWNGLTIAGISLLVLGVVGFIAATMVTKYWHPTETTSDSRRKSNQHSNSHFNSDKPVKLMDVITLLVLDIVESRKADRENRYERQRDDNHNRNTASSHVRNPYRTTNQDEASMH